MRTTTVCSHGDHPPTESTEGLQITGFGRQLHGAMEIFPGMALEIFVVNTVVNTWLING
jgi:hypothetical protein